MHTHADSYMLQNNTFVFIFWFFLVFTLPTRWLFPRAGCGSSRCCYATAGCCCPCSWTTSVRLGPLGSILLALLPEQDSKRVEIYSFVCICWKTVARNDQPKINLSLELITQTLRGKLKLFHTCTAVLNFNRTLPGRWSWECKHMTHSGWTWSLCELFQVCNSHWCENNHTVRCIYHQVQDTKTNTIHT